MPRLVWPVAIVSASLSGLIGYSASDSPFVRRREATQARQGAGRVRLWRREEKRRQSDVGRGAEEGVGGRRRVVTRRNTIIRIMGR